MLRIQNKKVYYLAVLSVIGGLSLVGFNGKKQLTESEKMTYLASVDPNMNNKIGTITKDAVSNLHVLFLTKTNETHLAIKDDTRYYDYFSGKEIKNFDFLKNNAIAIDYDLEIFLLQYNLIKDEYSDDELYKLLTTIKKDYKLGYSNEGNYTLKLTKEE